jgi:Protein of unknown function (DUF669)
MTTATFFDEPFDPATEEGTPPLKLLTPGKYRAVVIDGNVSDTKAKNGTMLHLTWSILGGDFDHRLVFQSIIVRHESADAQRIGRYMLKDLCDACGITEPVTDVTVFYHKPCTISVGIEKDKNGVYSDKNRVSRIMAVDPTTRPIPPQAPAVNGKTAAPGGDMNDSIPW